MSRPGRAWPRAARRLVLSTILAAFACGCDAAPSGDAPARGPDRLVTLEDGRKLNLRCRGSGAPLVILESGYGVGAVGWGRVQPEIARTTQVCAYDRAGYGFSDPGPLPRDGAAAARDLDQALDAAKLYGPYIVVGHSAGGFYGRLFAARRPGEVQGLVLVDPSVERVLPPAADGLQGLRRRAQKCLAAAEASPQPPPGDPQWDGCVSPRSSERTKANALRPEVWRNQLSEIDSIFGRTSEQVLRTGDLLAGVPTYVITASDTAASAPTVGYDKPQSIWVLQHVRLALSFDRGFQRTVLSSHLIQNDRPEVVVDAVLAMVKAARAATPPEPLPPSETPTTEGEAAFPELPR